MLVYLLYFLFFLSCVTLIVAVLLQPGKTDAGALFTSNISSSAFGPRGTATILSKITIAASTVFFLSALFLAMPAITGNISVLQTTAAPTETTPATDANTNTAANVDANANANTVSNTATNTNAAVNAPANANTATNVGANK